MGAAELGRKTTGGEKSEARHVGNGWRRVLQRQSSSWTRKKRFFLKRWGEHRQLDFPKSGSLTKWQGPCLAFPDLYHCTLQFCCQWIFAIRDYLTNYLYLSISDRNKAYMYLKYELYFVFFLHGMCCQLYTPSQSSDRWAYLEAQHMRHHKNPPQESQQGG